MSLDLPAPADQGDGPDIGQSLARLVGRTLCNGICDLLPEHRTFIFAAAFLVPGPGLHQGGSVLAVQPDHPTATPLMSQMCMGSDYCGECDTLMMVTSAP